MTYGCINDNYNYNYSSNYNIKDPTIITQVSIGYEALAIIVNRNNPLLECIDNGLHIEELHWIFSNRNSTLSNDRNFNFNFNVWSCLYNNSYNYSNQSMNVNIHGASQSLSEYDYFVSLVLSGNDIGLIEYEYKGYDSDSLILNGIINDRFGIGFIGFGYLNYFIENNNYNDKNSVVSVVGIYTSNNDEDTFENINNNNNNNNSSIIMPSYDNIRNGKYPLSRKLYINIEDMSFCSNDAIYNFINFILSDEGQSIIVNKTSYIPLTQVEINSMLNKTVKLRGALSSHYGTSSYGDLSGSIPELFSTRNDNNNNNNNKCDSIVIQIVGSSNVYPIAKVWGYHWIEWLPYLYNNNYNFGNSSNSSDYSGGSNYNRNREYPCVDMYLNVSGGGSSRAAKDICTAAAHIGDMSREWDETLEAIEIDPEFDIYQCLTEYHDHGYVTSSNNSAVCLYVLEIAIGMDGITIFVKQDSDLHECLEILGGLTYDNIKDIFSSAAGTKYSDILGSDCPVEPIIPAVASDSRGTLSFFCDEIFGSSSCSVSNNFNANAFSSTNDDDITQYVIDHPIAIGFTGFARYIRKKDDGLVALSIKKQTKATSDNNNDDNDAGFIQPTKETIKNASYPLTRQLYMNVYKYNHNGSDISGGHTDHDDLNYDYNYVMEMVKHFIKFGLNTSLGVALLEDAVGYVSLLDDDHDRINDELYKVENMEIILPTPGYDEYCDITHGTDWNCNLGVYGNVGGQNKYLISGYGDQCQGFIESFEISGSSTVYQIIKIMAIEFNQCLAYGCVNITLSGGGSNQGATDVCDGVSQIGSMSRDWKKDEGM